MTACIANSETRICRLTNCCATAAAPPTPPVPSKRQPCFGLAPLTTAHATIADSAGAHIVNAEAYKEAKDHLTDAAAEGEAVTDADVLDRLIKHRVSDAVDGSPQSF